MKLRFLGTGTSTGVPEVGCTCPVCTSTDFRDNRLRTSALLHTDDGHTILIDCGPDFREQMIRSRWFGRIDGVLITHEHYDHVGGLTICALIVDLVKFQFFPMPIRLNIFVCVCLIVL